MIIVGLNLAHDAGVCVVDNGRVLGLFQRERFTRVKRQSFLPAQFIRDCLGTINLSWRDVDFVAITSSQSWPLIMLDPDEFRIEHSDALADRIPLKGLDRTTMRRLIHETSRRNKLALERHAAFLQQGMAYSEYFGSDLTDRSDQSTAVPSVDWLVSPTWWRSKATAEEQRSWCAEIPNVLNHHFGYSPLVVTLDGDERPGVLMTHHLAHAASAFFTSDRDSAAIYTLDNGDGFIPALGYTGGVIAVGIGRRIAVIGPTYDYHGHFYQLIGEKLKLGHGGAAGKLMGLAPYGQPRFVTEAMLGNGSRVFGHAFSQGEKRDRFHVLEQLDESYRRRRDQVYQGMSTHPPEHDPGAYGADNVKRPDIDIAMTAQKVFEENALRSLRTLRDGLAEAKHSTSSLVLAGGTALNCPANSRIWAEGLFQEVFIPPYCDDSSLALGAALALIHDVLDVPRQPMAADRGEGAYLGLAYGSSALETALSARRDAIREETVEDAARDAAGAIAEGSIVAWYEGRSEVGPRALGHRSVPARSATVRSSPTRGTPPSGERSIGSRNGSTGDLLRQRFWRRKRRIGSRVRRPPPPSCCSMRRCAPATCPP